MHLTRARQALTPSTDLPSLRSASTTQDQILSALHDLQALYCPILHCLDTKPKTPSVLRHLSPLASAATSGTSTPLYDSGYASEAEDTYFMPKTHKNAIAASIREQEALTALRTDPFERSCAERWLTGFIARAEELFCDDVDDCEAAVDLASSILESFFTAEDPTAAGQDEEGDTGFTRTFQFPISDDGDAADGAKQIEVHLNDGIAGQGESHTDVGLQTWGASVLFSSLICTSPAAFGFTPAELPTSPRIIELGAGTGLVSLVLGKLLPESGVHGADVIATDFDEAVLENLKGNIATNFADETGCHGCGDSVPKACHLDWADPDLAPPLDQPADVLVATDVIYAPEHAEWLLDCAARLLAPEGVFWLVATVRPNGKFEGISTTVENAFEGERRAMNAQGKRLAIQESSELEKHRQGRGDESGYKLFKIRWGE